MVSAPPRPKFLQVTYDCYDVPSNGGAVTRRIGYELGDDSNPPQFYGQANVWEHLQGDLPSCGRDCPDSSSKPGHFRDEQSIGISVMGNTIQHVVQTFSAVTFSGQDLPVFVRGFGGDYGTLDIWKYSGFVSINGNTGGMVDPATGRLVPGTYTDCSSIGIR